MNIRTLIVDDEPLARERLRTLLEDEHDVEVVGECSNGVEAVADILETTPDLVLLDIEMPELDGFSVLERVRQATDQLPSVVFITAYHKYAIRAFEMHALDYLLKPFEVERLRQSVSRVRERMQNERTEDVRERILSMLGEIHSERRTYLERFAVQADERIFFVRTDEVEWIEAAGNYVRIHTATGSHMVRGTMQAVEAQLDPSRFLRVHRSAIVAVDRISEVQPWFRGEFKVVLAGGATLTVTRTYRDGLQDLLSSSQITS